MEKREPDVGDHVVFIDSQRRRISALVQSVHGEGYHPAHLDGEYVPPLVNLVYVSPDSNKTDQYGRQIEHDTSVEHALSQGRDRVVGRCWHWPDEVVEINEANIATKK